MVSVVVVVVVFTGMKLGPGKMGYITNYINIYIYKTISISNR